MMNYSDTSALRYEILTYNSDNPLNTDGIHYVRISNKFSQPLVDTDLTHHFPTEAAAKDFCKGVAKGSISLYQLISESVHAHEALAQNHLYQR